METSPRSSASGTPSSLGDAGASAAPSGGSQTSNNARAHSRTVLSDRYHLREELGRGAFGLVFKGVDTRTGGAVAIKQLSLAGISAETLQSIMGEIELLKNLNHKNIVKYIGSFKTRTHLYIILEYMDRGAISSVIKPSQFGAFPESLVAVYIAQVLQGLAYLHDQGVVHRDIKGANILTTSEGLVKLADFGVAARLSELEADRDKSRISVVGTPYWMAPEVIEMTSTTPASDIWSVACLSIELLTGQPPYFDLQPMSALFRIVQDEKPELPTKMSGDMHDFLHQCFQKDPQKRPSARDLLKHKWITYNRRTLRSSWNRTQGAKNMGKRTDAHKSVSTVVEQILQAEADEFAASAAAAAAGKPMSPQPDVTNRGPAQIPMNQSRGSTLTDSRTGSVPGSRGPSLETLPNLGESPAAVPMQSSTEPLIVPLQQNMQAILSLPQPNPTGHHHLTPPLPLSHHQGQHAGLSTKQAPVVPERMSNGGESQLEPAQEMPARPRDAYAAPSSDITHEQGLLEGLLQDQPARREAGEDLMVWLELREQHQLGPAEDGMPSSEDMLDIVDGAVNSHQQAAEVRRLIAIWRHGYGRKTGLVGQPQTADRAAKSMEAGQSLLAMCREHPGRVETFLAEEGGVVLVELLQDPCNERVAVHTLQFLNELVTLNVKALGSSALLGVVTAVTTYAVNGGPLSSGPSLDARLQAAHFLQFLAQTNLLTAQLLLTCQGIPVLLSLIEPDFEEFGFLIHIGVLSIWRILELHGSVSMNQICRLLSGAGLAQKLVYAFRSAIAYSQNQKANGKAKQARSGTKTALDSSLEQQNASPTSQQALSREQDLAAGSPLQAVPSRSSYSSLDASEGQPTLLDKMANLLLVMAHADTAVKGRLCETDTLRTLFTAIEDSPEALQLTVLKAIKQLTSDPSMLEALEGAGTIGSLGKYLKGVMSLPIQVEALHALHNLCKISRLRQEAAAAAGLVPYLMNLAQMSPKQVEAEPLQEQLRQMAISLLCGMVHSTASTRMALWNNNGLHTLLELLKEEDWQGPALEALAAWLYEDMSRIEGRLSQQQSIARFVQLFNTYSTRGGSNALARLLEPFLKILRRSPQITIEVAIAGLAGIVVEMLKTASALTALSLLQMVRVIYEHHPRPKEFVAKYSITDQLRELSKARGSQSSVLVNKQATHLLHAFQINSIF